MSNKPQIKNVSEPTHHSKLERFSVGFEYDKTLTQVKHDMKARIL